MATNTQAKTPVLTEVTIKRGTFHYLDKDGAPAAAGPGKTVKVDAEDLAMLRRLQFIASDDDVAPVVVQDGTLKIEAQDGPTVSAA